MNQLVAIGLGLRISGSFVASQRKGGVYISYTLN